MHSLKKIRLIIWFPYVKNTEINWQKIYYFGFNFPTINLLGCDDGYHGPDCLLQFHYPSYGKKCKSMCNCTSLECNHIKGCGNMKGI